MAKFWTNIEKHPDTVEKHKITDKEIQFLQGLQRELNTQNNLGQADPMYWVIRDYEKIYGDDLNNADGIEMHDTSSWETLCTFQCRNIDIDEAIETIIKAIQDYGYDIDECLMEDIKSSYDLRNLIECVSEAYTGQFHFLEYQEVPVDKGMFLTHEAAIKHLKDNHYHYCPHAHTYAQTSWRSSEEKLWHILQTVDFERLK